MRTLSGVNIQYPISQIILSGEKTVETRTYSLPLKYVDQPLYLIETPGGQGDFAARIVAIVVFGESFLYSNREEFRRDVKRHFVTENSLYDWKDRPKWGWPILKIEVLNKPFIAPKRKGIVFTKSIRPK